MSVIRLFVTLSKHIILCVSNTSERLLSTYIVNSEELIKVQKNIEEHTCVTRNTLTPEIALHLITPSCPLWSSPLENVPFVDPFWAFYWPGGQALTRYILDNPSSVSGQSVLDIGSGCGASAIAAALSKACHVTANDIDPVAGHAISMNCALNNVDVTVCTEQIIGKSKDVGDCILVGDMFYDEQFAEVLFLWLQMLRRKGKHIFIGDPGRVAFVKYVHYFQCLASFPLGLDDFSPGYSQVSIWKMK